MKLRLNGAEKAGWYLVNIRDLFVLENTILGKAAKLLKMTVAYHSNCYLI
jgi:hypothetical protein